MNTQEIELTLDNLDILTNDYHRDVIKSALLNKKFDRIFYTHKPKQMSVFRFVEFHGAYQGQTEIRVSHKQLTFHTLANIIFDNEKGSFFDNFAKSVLMENEMKNIVWHDNPDEIVNHVKNKTWIIAESKKFGVTPLFYTNDYGSDMLFYFSGDETLKVNSECILHSTKDIIKWRLLPTTKGMNDV